MTTNKITWRLLAAIGLATLISAIELISLSLYVSVKWSE